MEPIAQLMDEHLQILDLAGEVRRAVANDRAAAIAAVTELTGLLVDHVDREERGIFTALKDDGDYLDEVLALEEEHVGFGVQLAALDPGAPDFGERLERMLTELGEHIDRENHGIFPVAVVTLGATGWETVRRAHEHGHDHGHHDHSHEHRHEHAGHTRAPAS